MTEPTPEQPEQPKQTKQTRITIDLPKELPTAYSNLVFINYTPAEVILDFAQVLPRTPRGAVVARVVMNPIHAKLLHAALGQNLANFERQFGEIRLPNPRPNIADNFFRAPGDNDEEDGSQNG